MATDCADDDRDAATAAIADDMTTVFAFIARVHRYPESLGYEADFDAILHAWRPELSKDG